MTAARTPSRMLLTLQLALQALGMADSPDGELVEMFVATRADRYFGELYRRYGPRVYARCLTMLGDEAEARDAVQDVFERALRRVGGFRRDAKFSTWLYAIANNHCIDRLRARERRRAREAALPDDDALGEAGAHPAPGGDDGGDWLEEQTPEAIAHILAHLGELDRAALVLRYMDGLSTRDLAAALGVGESAAKMRLKRARGRALAIYRAWAAAHNAYA